MKEGGAKVVERLFSPQESRIECIVSDTRPGEYLEAKFKRLKVPVLNKEWIVQSLLSQVTKKKERNPPWGGGLVVVKSFKDKEEERRSSSSS